MTFNGSSVSAPAAIRVLLIEDNPGDARLLREELLNSTTPIEITHSPRLDQGLVRLAEEPFDLLLLDLDLPDSRGFETFERAIRKASGTPIVVLSGLSDVSVGMQTVQNGAQDYLVKGQISQGLLERTIRYALERSRSNLALKESEERYRQFFEDDLAGAFIASADGRILACNPAFARMFGFPDVSSAIGRSVAPYFPDLGSAAAMRERIRREKFLRDHEFAARRRDGTPVHLLANLVGGFGPAGELDQIKGYLFDDSQRKQLEEELRQSRNMDSIGRLAGGVAHDFNNLLTTILGHSDLLLARFEPDDPGRVELDEIRAAGQRAADLTGQLLAFSRRQVLQPKILDLKEVVRSLRGRLERLLGGDVSLVTDLSAETCRVQADAGQIEQVIVNLCVNARDAMPSGGSLTLATRVVRAEEVEGTTPARLAPGLYVLLSVEDVGRGIDPDLLPLLFEPFFTTKDLGRGSGLGLSTVYGIVKQSGGEITVESDKGRGTIFRVYLPLVGRSQPVPAVAAPAIRAIGSETILLVEDDDAVRSIARRLLQASGYHVLEASGGLEALQLCDRYAGEIDLLLTDLMMPEISGQDLAPRVLELRPAIRVLFMSGYTEDGLLRRHLSQSATAFIQKPFTAAGLTNKIREILDSRDDIVSVVEIADPITR